MGEQALRFPENVRVGALDYKVKRWTPQAAENTRALGLCDRDTCTILIKEGMAPQKEAEVLIHEVFHAAWDGAGLNLDEYPSEERTVNGLGYTWLQVLRDNPELFAYVNSVFAGSTLPLTKGRSRVQ